MVLKLKSEAAGAGGCKGWGFFGRGGILVGERAVGVVVVVVDEGERTTRIGSVG